MNNLHERCLKMINYGTWMLSQGRIDHDEYCHGLHGTAQELAAFLELPEPPVEHCDGWILDHVGELEPVSMPTAFGRAQP